MWYILLLGLGGTWRLDHDDLSSGDDKDSGDNDDQSSETDSEIDSASEDGEAIGRCVSSIRDVIEDEISCWRKAAFTTTPFACVLRCCTHASSTSDSSSGEESAESHSRLQYSAGSGKGVVVRKLTKREKKVLKEAKRKKKKLKKTPIQKAKERLEATVR